MQAGVDPVYLTHYQDFLASLGRTGCTRQQMADEAEAFIAVLREFADAANQPETPGPVRRSIAVACTGCTGG